MSVQASAKSQYGVPAWWPEFHAEFIRQIFQLVAAGYDRLGEGRTKLANAEEPAISGRLHCTIMDYLDSPSAPEWTNAYEVHDDAPEHGQRGNSGQKLGKDRPRIDLKFRRSGSRPRPSFRFEAKRLYRSDSVAAYTGPAGLGCFLTGYYDPANGAGMLGYVQSGQPGEWAQKIQKKLSGCTWQSVQLTPGLPHSYTTEHPREGQPTPTKLTIYHLLLCFLGGP